MNTAAHSLVWRRAALVAIGALLITAGAVFLANRLSAPDPLTAEETRAITSAIRMVAPGEIHNLRRDRDGAVRGFVADGRLSKQMIVVHRQGDMWQAAVETVFF